VKIKSESAHFIIDTGCCSSIISSSLYYRIPENIRPELEKVDSSVRLQVADDGLLAIEGQCDLEFLSSGQKFNVTVFVAPIHEDGLIGLDFLYENNYQLGVQSGLKLNGRKCKTFIERVPLRAVRICCASKTIIQANSECIIPGEAVNLRAINSQFGLICPSNDKLNERVSVGSVLVSPGTISANKLPVRLINVSNQKVRLDKGVTLGYLQEIDSADLLQENVTFNQEKSTRLSDNFFKYRHFELE
jgi:hypothetical protein